MVRRTGIALLVMLLLVASLAGAAQYSLAQGGATPAAQGPALFTAPGVQTSLLASGDATNVGIANPHLLLERITVPNGASTGLHTTAGPELLYVESGTVTFHDTFGFSSTLTGPAHLLMAQSTGYSIDNTSSAPASLLRLGMAPGEESALPVTATAAVTPLASPGASPVASPVPSAAGSAVTTKTLLDTASPEMQQGNVTLSIGRATWDAGASSGKQSHTGPLGVYVEQGILNVTSPSGMEGQVPLGKSVVLPVAAPLQARNAQRAPATALLVTIAPTGQPAMSEIVPTPTPTIPPTVTTTLAPTAPPSPTSTTAAESGRVLYEATGKEFSTWPKSDEWQYVNGLLVSVGRNNRNDQWVPAPFVPDTADYAVEAEVQIIRSGDGNRYFTVVARGTTGDPDGDVAGFWDYYGGAFIASAIGADPLTKTGFDPGNEWHTYRLEVRGNVITLLIDGALVLQTTNNTNLAPGRVGLATRRNTQVSVRRFRVIALDETTQSAPRAPRAAQPTGVASKPAVKASARPGVLSSGQLAHSVNTGGHWDVWVHDFASNQNIQVTKDQYSDQWAPVYSHDGNKLAYLSDASGSNQAWLMQPDGAKQHQVSAWDGPMIRYVDWSSDDRSFYVMVQGGAAKQVLQMPVDGGDLSDLIPPSSNCVVTMPQRNPLRH